MPTQLPTRTRTPLIVDQESLVDAVAMKILAQLGDLFARVTVQGGPVTVPTPTITVSPAEINPTITVNPSAVTIASDNADMCAMMSTMSDTLSRIEVLLAAPMTRTVSYNSNGQIVSMTERRG